MQEFGAEQCWRLCNSPYDQAGYCSQCSSVSSIIKTFHALLKVNKRFHNPNIPLLHLMLLYLTKLGSRFDHIKPLLNTMKSIR